MPSRTVFGSSGLRLANPAGLDKFQVNIPLKISLETRIQQRRANTSRVEQSLHHHGQPDDLRTNSNGVFESLKRNRVKETIKKTIFSLPYIWVRESKKHRACKR